MYVSASHNTLWANILAKFVPAWPGFGTYRIFFLWLNCSGVPREWGKKKQFMDMTRDCRVMRTHFHESIPPLFCPCSQRKILGTVIHTKAALASLQGLAPTPGGVSVMLRVVF